MTTAGIGLRGIKKVRYRAKGHHYHKLAPGSRKLWHTSGPSTVELERDTVLFPDKSYDEETDKFTASDERGDTSRLLVYEAVRFIQTKIKMYG